MIRYQADWLLPISASPIHRGWVSVAAGRITGVGTDESTSSTPAIDLGRAAILPALVNVHTHLELSYLHGRVPAGTTFTQWVRTLMALRRYAARHSRIANVGFRRSGWLRYGRREFQA